MHNMLRYHSHVRAYDMDSIVILIHSDLVLERASTFNMVFTCLRCPHVQIPKGQNFLYNIPHSIYKWLGYKFEVLPHVEINLGMFAITFSSSI